MLTRRVSMLVLAATAAVALATNAPAHAGPGESHFTSLANSERTSRGMASYRVAGDLVALARRHSAEMAAKGTIYHNSRLKYDVSNWRAVGENVGMGGSVSAIHQAFMNSAAHRANIVDRDFTEVGIGTATDSKGVIYVTQVFRQPLGSAPAPRPTATRPKPAAPTGATVARATTSRPTVTRPVAPRPAPAPSLAAKLAAAAAVAREHAPTGTVDRAVTFVEVMGALG